MELNDFKPLISEIVLYISEGRYDEVQGFLMKDGRLTLDTLRKEVEAFRGGLQSTAGIRKGFRRCEDIENILPECFVCLPDAVHRRGGSGRNEYRFVLRLHE